MVDSSQILERARWVLELEGRAVLAKARGLGESFCVLARTVYALAGRVAITGVGKSGIIGRKIASTLSSTGTPALFLNPVEALHGDLGMLTANDLLIAISNSGETHEVLAVAAAARGIGVDVIAMTGRERSSLARAASSWIDTSVDREACPLDLAPTASTTVTLAIGDALAMVLVELRGFTREHYARLHPEGNLSQRLRYRVQDLMRVGALLPTVDESASLADALAEMTRRENLGVTLIAAGDGKLRGILTDGDVRRIFVDATAPADVLARPVSTYMSRNPHSIAPEASAADALQQMEARSISSLAVVDPKGRAVGIVHLHDILGRGKIVL
jgi:arabinose-5-phosphate isomerase